MIIFIFYSEVQALFQTTLKKRLKKFKRRLKNRK